MSITESDLSLGEEIICWIESECRVPEGALIGRPIELMDWQKGESSNKAMIRSRSISSAASRSSAPLSMQPHWPRISGR
jgi:hypothetical protein